jgi:hypothetical protein
LVLGLAGIFPEERPFGAAGDLSSESGRLCRAHGMAVKRRRRSGRREHGDRREAEPHGRVAERGAELEAEQRTEREAERGGRRELVARDLQMVR